MLGSYHRLLGGNEEKRTKSWQLWTWEALNSAHNRADMGAAVFGRFFSACSVAFILMTVLETDSIAYHPHHEALDKFQDTLAVVISVEYAFALWSAPSNPVEVNSSSPLRSRLRWAFRFLPAVNFVVLASYWTTLMLRSRLPHSEVVDAFRLLRLLRIFDLFALRRVQKAFAILRRVLERKGEDILASMIILFVAVVFSATCVDSMPCFNFFRAHTFYKTNSPFSAMYVAEGGRPFNRANKNLGFLTFESIPIAMYWGVVTITTIG